jgi:hypothetical protein
MIGKPHRIAIAPNEDASSHYDSNPGFDSSPSLVQGVVSFQLSRGFRNRPEGAGAEGMDNPDVKRGSGVWRE